MYQYIDTFLIENVSMCRYKYISKVSDTYTVSDTKGLVSMNCFLSNVSNKGRYTTSILLSISKFNFALAQTTSN